MLYALKNDKVTALLCYFVCNACTIPRFKWFSVLLIMILISELNSEPLILLEMMEKNHVMYTLMIDQAKPQISSLLIHQVGGL